MFSGVRREGASLEGSCDVIFIKIRKNGFYTFFC